VSSITVKSLSQLRNEKAEKLVQEEMQRGEAGLQAEQDGLRRELVKRMLAEKALFDGRLKNKGQGGGEDKSKSTRTARSKLSNGDISTGVLEEKGAGLGERPASRKRPARPKDLDISPRKKSRKTGTRQPSHSKEMPKSLKSTWKESGSERQSEVSVDVILVFPPCTSILISASLERIILFLLQRVPTSVDLSTICIKGTLYNLCLLST